MNLLFAPTSRYASVETATIEDDDGTITIYLRRRFLPQPERYALVREHVVSQGERLDNVTATYLDDPEQFWRICDANRAMRPVDLMARIGRKLRITLPEGVPGMPDG
ncbi:MAG: LysM domain-containing protein [Sphingomonas sp.]